MDAAREAKRHRPDGIPAAPVDHAVERRRDCASPQCSLLDGFIVHPRKQFDGTTGKSEDS
jgi:hypothetical protein